MHAIYMSIDDSLRRICNQAFFERIHVYEIENADIVRAEHGEPFDALLDPNLHAAALAYQASVRAGEDVKPADVASLNIDYWVGPVGLEPTTYGLKVRSSAIELEARSASDRGPRMPAREPTSPGTTPAAARPGRRQPVCRAPAGLPGYAERRAPAGAEATGGRHTGIPSRSPAVS